MEKFKKLIPLAIYLASFLYFLVVGLISFLILRSEIALETIMKIISVHVLLILISAKFVLSKSKQESRGVIYLGGLLPIILFGYFLIFATGGLSSPFLVLTHFFAISVAFLITPQIAVSFIAATIVLMAVNLAFDSSAVAFVRQTPFAAILYFVAYIALVPFSYVLSREYKVKEEWVKILEKQIATSKTQEEELLKNITECVLVVNRRLNLVYINKAAKEFSQYGEEILGQNLFKFFSFKDKDGRNIEPYSLPFGQVVSSKTQTTIENIQVSTKEKKFVKVDMKILPVIGPEEPLGLVLIIEERSAKEEAKKKKESIASMALGRFLSFIDKQRQILTELQKTTSSKENIGYLIRHNQELEHLAADFVYSLRLESGEIGTLSNLVDIGKITEDVINSQRSRAQELSISLVAKGTEKEQPIQPKTTLKVPIEKRIFAQVFVLGDITWIHDSLKRILELALLLCQKNAKIQVSVTRDESLGKVIISSQSNKIPPNLTPQLFEKFYGSLQELPELSQTSGLEGFIAKNLLERMGAGAVVETSKNPPLIIFTVTFGLKAETVN